MALFDGQLENLGIGNNAVTVPAGTVIDAMQVTNSAGFPATVVDMTIGDGTTASRFDLDQGGPISLLIGSMDLNSSTISCTCSSASITGSMLIFASSIAFCILCGG